MVVFILHQAKLHLSDWECRKMPTRRLKKYYEIAKEYLEEKRREYEKINKK